MRRINPLLGCAGIMCFLASTGVRADALHVTVADALSNQAYDLSFAPAGATALSITPLPGYPTSSVRSIVYVANEQTAKADLIAADNRNNLIVRYAGASGPALTVWPGTSPGPSTPIGLSVDGFGDLFAFRGDVGHPELWVLKRNPALPPGAGFLAPVVVDKTGFGSSNQARVLDSLVVTSPTSGGLYAGDLLVLINDGRVLRYSAASLKNFLAGGGLTDPNGEGHQPKTLITVAKVPPGHASTGIALWPVDGSLLVSTVDGAVLRWDLTRTSATLRANAFASGLGTSSTGVGSLLGIIRTFVDSGSNMPFALFDIPQRSKILELTELPGGCPNLAVACNPPVATITTIANPVGMAITDAATSNQDCVTSGNPDGCALLNGAVKVGVSSAQAGGNVIAVSCTFNDPRFTNLGNCNGSQLLASSVCPGYPNTYVPAYLCGASGASGRAMTLLKFEEASGFPQAPADLLVNVELSAESILGGANLLCPQLAMGWAPLSAEGTIPEGNVMMEPTSNCGSTRALPPGHSLMLVGAQINPGTDLVALANQKFDNLSGTITAATNMSSTPKQALASCVTHAKTLLNSSTLVPANRYACAAHQAWTCDQTVVSTQFSVNTNTLSNLSAIKGRLENLIMHIDNRIIPASNNLPPTTPPWPQTDPLPGAGTVATCDITAPSVPAGLTASYASSNNKLVNLSWTASNDPGQGVASIPGPYASGVAGYHVYLNGIEQPGSPTSSTALQITLSASVKHNVVTITAFDQATPTPIVSAPATLTLN